MNPTSSDTHPLFGDAERTRILRSFLVSLVMTPGLLFIEPARQIISLEATLLAIALGVVLGIVIAIGLADVELQDVNNVTASVVALVSILMVSVIIWLVVPHQYIGSVLQFTIAFVWTMPVTQLVHHRYRASKAN